MEDCKEGQKKKKGPHCASSVPQKRFPNAVRGVDPDSVMQMRPSWNFVDCDTDEACKWAFCESRLGGVIWKTILPKLRDFERMTWSDILIAGKKQNHSIKKDELNKAAQERLSDLRIEAEDVFSLRLGGKLRLYGLLIGPSFHIIWYDDNHGDNETCVCRSKLKHT